MDNLETIITYTLFNKASYNTNDLIDLSKALVKAIKNETTEAEQHNMKIVVDCLIDLDRLNKNNFCAREPKEIMNDFGIVPTREITIVTPIIPIHKEETIVLRNLYEKYDNYFTIIESTITTMIENERHWKLESELRDLTQRMHEDRALKEILEMLIQTLRDIKQININRRVNTAKRLLFLPAKGTNNTFPLEELHKVPWFHNNDEKSSLFVTWQNLSRIAEIKGLNWRTVIKTLADKTGDPIKEKINQLNNLNRNLANIIGSLQAEYEEFPREEDWDCAFKNFTRDKGQSIPDAYDKLFQITVRKYHKASNEDIGHIFIKTVYENLQKFVSKKAYHYIKEMEQGEKRPEEITMLDVQRCLALAKHYEDTMANWETKFLTNKEQEKILKFSNYTRKEKEQKLKEVSQELWGNANPFWGELDKMFENKDKYLKPTQDVKYTTTRGTVYIEYKFINPNTIFQKGEIEPSKGKRSRIAVSINHNKWKGKYVRMF